MQVHPTANRSHTSVNIAVRNVETVFRLTWTNRKISWQWQAALQPSSEFRSTPWQLLLIHLLSINVDGIRLSSRVITYFHGQLPNEDRWSKPREGERSGREVSLVFTTWFCRRMSMTYCVSSRRAPWSREMDRECFNVSTPRWPWDISWVELLTQW